MTRSTRRLMRMLRLDRMLLLVGVLVVALIALIALPLWAGVVASAVAAAGGYKVAELIGPPPAVQAAMTIVPRQIAALTDVPAVVFGHTHEPQRIPLPDGATYLNSGTWLPAIRPGLLRSFTHVAILREAEGGARCELRQWKNGASRLYVDHRDATPTPAPAPVVVPAPVVPAPVAIAPPLVAAPAPVEVALDEADTAPVARPVERPANDVAIADAGTGTRAA